jgi:phosphatidylinositol-3-phosphatase
MVRVALTAAFAVGLAALPGAAAPRGGSCGTAARPPAVYDHVVWIVMENHAYSQIVGSSSAPYLNRLARSCGLATGFFAETHPSLPNYIAMTSGSPQGIGDDSAPSAHRLAAASIFSRLGPRGWRALEESMPSPCALGDAGRYAVRHNPAAYYTTVRRACRADDVPLARTPDLRARFTFVTPNLCHDMHDCGVAAGDGWLNGFVPKLLATREYRAGRTAVFVTWDEDDGSSANHIATLVLAPSVKPGTRSGARFDHYSLLRTTEQLLGLKRLLGRAASATSMRAAFNV